MDGASLVTLAGYVVPIISRASASKPTTNPEQHRSGGLRYLAD